MKSARSPSTHSTRDRFRAWADSLGETSAPMFGQFALGVLLVLCAALVLGVEEVPNDGAVRAPASVLGYLVPHSLLSSGALFTLGRLGFLAAAACWLFRKWVPYSGWLTLGFYALVTSVHHESLPLAPGAYALPCWLLSVYALWFHFYAREIRVASQNGEYWTTPLFPQWVSSATVFSLAVFLTLSGWSKLLESGFQWGDGLSLQIWTKFAADRPSPLSEFFVTSRVNAMIVQSGILFLECFAFLAVFSRGARVVIGLGLIVCYATVLPVFGLTILANVALIALFFLPLHDWAPRIVPKVKAAVEYSFTY